MTKVSDTPLVIVTGPNKRLRFGWWATRFRLWRLGLNSQYLCPGQDSIPIHYAAAIITGGDDIDPKHYGASGAAGAKYDAARDELEISVIKRVQEDKKPLLGICRGAQLINVVNGGTLHSDLRPLRKHTPNRNSIFAIKRAILEPNCFLGSLFDQRSLPVNSLHNQAVDKPGKDLTIVAKDADGFVQAIECSECSAKQFLIGVQWHPEYMPWSRNQVKIFKALKHAIESQKAQQQ